MENTYRQPQRVMHPLKFRTLEVKKVTDLSARMKRITFTSPDLNDFISGSPDDHIKLFFPLPGQAEPILPTRGPDGPVFPEGVVMRDYTPLSAGAENFELDIEFFLHDEGPAAEWARNAKPGHKLGAGGPRGSMVVPYDFEWYLLVGDEAALPSFTRRLKELPANARVLVFIEVGSESEKREFTTASNADIHWVNRNNFAPGSVEPLKEALLKTSFPHGDYFSWIATELETSKILRELLETVRGANPEWIKATGYWKKKFSENL